MTNYSTVKKIYQDDMHGTPYGVETLVEVSDSDETQGSSEMAWFATKEEQENHYQTMLVELKEAGLEIR